MIASALQMVRAPETLSEYVRRVRNEKGYSLSDVEYNSGRKISGAYVSRIENGRVSNPSMSKAQALARGLRVPEKELFEAAFGKQTQAEEQDFRTSALFAVYERLKGATPEKRDLYEKIISIILKDLDQSA